MKFLFKKKNIFKFAFVFLIFLVYFQMSSAFEATSTDFILERPTLGDSGGEATSTDFGDIGIMSEISAGESTSTDFILQSGFMYFGAFSPKSQNWKWYEDESNETPTTALAAENVAPIDIDNRNIIKLRMTLKETGGSLSSNIKFKLQFSESSDFSSGVNDVVGTTTCSTASLWCYGSGAGEDNALISTKVLSDADSCSGNVGNGCGTHNASSTSSSTFDFTANAATEFEFTIENQDAVYNKTYFFRAYDVTNDSAISLNTGESYPSLTTKGTTLTFSISGLSSGVSTEGVTTDITTTSTSVPFGNLTAGSPVEGAQRLSITTNAVYGYKVYVAESQVMTDTAADTMSTVSGTNASPSAFAISGGSHSAYGYHSGDDILSSGTTGRFAVNDTFAKFTTGSEEAAFNSGPVTSETTDMVYKIEVDSSQPAGSYQSSIVYIASPTF